MPNLTRCHPLFTSLIRKQKALISSYERKPTIQHLSIDHTLHLHLHLPYKPADLGGRHIKLYILHIISSQWQCLVLPGCSSRNGRGFRGVVGGALALLVLAAGGGGGDTLTTGAHAEGGGRHGLARVRREDGGWAHPHGPQLFHLSLQPHVLFPQWPKARLQILTLYLSLL